MTGMYHKLIIIALIGSAIMKAVELNIAQRNTLLKRISNLSARIIMEASTLSNMIIVSAFTKKYSENNNIIPGNMIIVIQNNKSEIASLCSWSFGYSVSMGSLPKIQVGLNSKQYKGFLTILSFVIKRFSSV